MAVPGLPSADPEEAGMSDCVIFIGLQGSGKTTFYRRRFAATHRHISKDDWPNAARKSERQARLLEESLAAGAAVVVDNTNPSPADREAIISIARAHGARVIGYYFDVSTREAVSRNRQRQGRERVPDVAIFTTARRMVPPRAGEGFAELFRVSITDDGQFDVRPMEVPSTHSR